MKKVLIVIVGIVIVAAGWSIFAKKNNNSNHAATNTQTFNKKQLSTDTADSLWLVVNKTRPLNPSDYTPANLVSPNIPLRLAAGNEEMLMRRDAAKALENLAAAAEKDAGLNIMLSSAYRSYNFQNNLYNRYVREQGRETADQQSARPGYSEHQTGLAADVEPASRECEVESCFGDMPEGKWVAANAYKYGFVIRYPEGKQAITGYIYEPWHLRYVGTELAKAVHDAGDPTLEEFFDLPAAPDYK